MPGWGRKPRLVTTLTLACAGAAAIVAVPATNLVDIVSAPAAARPPMAAPSSVGTAPVPLDPAEFPAGACVAFPPLRGNHGQTVFLDAGHGGLDPGALGTAEDGTTLQEKDLTLPVVLDATKLLRADGYRVVDSRITDTGVVAPDPSEVAAGALTIAGKHTDEKARITCANLSGASALLSVHFDALSDPSVGGSVTLYDPSRSFATRNITLATLVENDVVATLHSGGWQVENRGVLSDVGTGGPALSGAGASYGHLELLGPPAPGYLPTVSAMPGALTEPLFITDPVEGSIAAGAAGQQAIAVGIQHALEQFFGQSTAS